MESRRCGAAIHTRRKPASTRVDLAIRPEPTFHEKHGFPEPLGLSPSRSITDVMHVRSCNVLVPKDLAGHYDAFTKGNLVANSGSNLAEGKRRETVILA